MVSVIESLSQDKITDISFDWNGKRIATCSTDRKIRIYSKFKETEKIKWRKTAEFAAHDAPITRIKWGHPDHGNILASCSMDKSIKIFEERKINPIISMIANTSLKAQDSNFSEVSDDNWIPKHKQFENVQIEDIKFAPKHLGLILAAAFKDGKVRLYEATDPMNLTAWKNIAEFQLDAGEINCISWAKNEFDAVMMCIGSNGVEKPPNEKPVNCLSVYKKKDNLWEFSFHLEKDNRMHNQAVYDVSWGMLNGKSFYNIVSCGKDGLFIWYLNFDLESCASMQVLDVIVHDKNNIRKATFNFFGTVIFTNGEDNFIRVWKADQNKKWVEIDQFTANIEEPIQQ